MNHRTGGLTLQGLARLFRQLGFLSPPRKRPVRPKKTRAAGPPAATRPPSARVLAMRRHIAGICRAHDIRVGNHSRGGSASRRGRFIRIRPVKSAVTYAIALHEIGHVLGPWQSQPRLYKEAGAWVWARSNALEWTPPMQKTMVRSLTSYLRWQQRRHRHVRLPEPDHAFWQLLGEDNA